MTAHTRIMPCLSINDAKVLNALFDAESSLSSGSQIQEVQHSLPNIQEEEFHRLEAEEKRIVKPLATADAPGIDAIETAIRGLDDLLKRAPKYARGYVNRAQARRMILGDRSLTADERPAVSSIVSDLSVAIDSASPPTPEGAVSALQAKILASAYTHRAHLYYHIAKSGDLSSLPDSMRDMGESRLEELASRDFMMGGRYGNDVARQMSVRTNPYAKMCGAIVREALQTEMEGSS